jgi:hypothetical protein
MNKAMQQLGALIRSDDGAHMTNLPLFVVFENERINTDEDPTDYDWHDEDWNLADDAKAAELDSHYEEHDEEPEGWTRMGYIVRRRFVTACLTKQAAERYIENFKHRLNEPHIYVHSLYQNAEMTAVREFLIGLPAPEAEPS